MLPDAIRAVAGALGRLGYQNAVATLEYPGGVLLDPDSATLLQQARRAASAGNTVVIFYTGHGVKPSSEDFYICTANTDQEVSYTTTAITPRQLVLELLVKAQDASGQLRPVPPGQQPTALVIIDACMSGWVGADMIRAGLENVGNQNVWVMASTDKVTLAGESLFANALADALTHPAVGPSQPLLHLDDIVDQINEALGWKSDQQARWWPPARGSTGGPVFFPNPLFAPELAGLTVADQGHWLSRVQSGSETLPLAGLSLAGRNGFGRVRAAEDLASWLSDPTRGGMAVVTGSPGAGKSTLLALPVLLRGFPQTRDGVVGAGGVSSPMVDAVASRLPAEAPVLAVHARGLTNDQVAARIGTALGLEVTDANGFLDQLRHAHGVGGSVLIVDAIDEAVTPEVLLFGLLNPAATRLGLKTVIGARRHVLSSAGPVDQTIDLDSERYRDRQALIDYISDLLTAKREPGLRTCYQDSPPGTVATLATALAEQATSPLPDHGEGASFLLGRLLAVAVRGRSSPVDPSVPGWLAHLPSAVGDAFDEDLGRRLGERQGSARALLAALAWARGTGLPKTTLLVPVARALAPLVGADPEQILESDVALLLDRVGDYIIESPGAGDRSAYRPFHDLLTRHLRGEPTEQQALDEKDPEPAWRELQMRAEGLITEALLETVPKDANGVYDWTQAHPYLLDHMAQHAHAAGHGEFALLVSDVGFLATANPNTLTPLLNPLDPRLREVARPYRRARPLLGEDAHDNVTHLEEAWLALNGRLPPPQQLQPSYQPLMSWAGRDDSLLTLTADAQSVFSLVFGVDEGGGPVLASGTKRGVQFWDASNGDRLISPLISGAGVTAEGDAAEELVKTLAVAPSVEDDPLLAVAGRGPVARIWRPSRSGSAGDSARTAPSALTAMGRETRIDVSIEGLQPPFSVDTVAVGTLPDGETVLVTLADQVVRRWDAATGKAVGQPLKTRASCVGVGASADVRVGPTSDKANAPCVGLGAWSDGHLQIATGDDKGIVRFWNAVTGHPVGEPFPTHTGGVTHMAFGTCEHGRPLMATTGADRVVRLWGCNHGQSGQPLPVKSKGVSSLAFGTSATGLPLLATGHFEGIIAVWDCVTNDLIGSRLLIGHNGPVYSLAFGTGNDGRSLLASGGADGTIRLWDPTPLDPVPEGPTVDLSSSLVTSVAFGSDCGGRALLATGGQEGVVRLWDPTTGIPHGDPIPLHRGAVYAIAFGRGPLRQPVIATGSGDGTVRLWDLKSGTELEDPFAHQGGVVWTLACGEDGDGAPLIAWSDGKHGIALWSESGRRTISQTGVMTLAIGELPGGPLLLAASESSGLLQLWDPTTGARIGGPLAEHQGSVPGLAFSAHSHERLWLASCGNELRLWDPITRLGRVLHDEGDAFAVAFTACTHGRSLGVRGT